MSLNKDSNSSREREMHKKIIDRMNKRLKKINKWNLQTHVTVGHWKDSMEITYIDKKFNLTYQISAGENANGNYISINVKDNLNDSKCILDNVLSEWYDEKEDVEEYNKYFDIIQHKKELYKEECKDERANKNKKMTDDMFDRFNG